VLEVIYLEFRNSKELFKIILWFPFSQFLFINVEADLILLSLKLNLMVVINQYAYHNLHHIHYHDHYFGLEENYQIIFQPQYQDVNVVLLQSFSNLTFKCLSYLVYLKTSC
jgi:hypothetical protein